MAEILKEWLTERLQRPIKWEAQEFGDMMKDGHIIASVLYSYHVINEDKLFLIRRSNVNVDIKNNWNYLVEWLREVEVHLTDEELSSIMEGKGSTLLRLFYQMFLHLDKRDRTNFLKQERKNVSTLVEKLKHRFTVEAIKDEEEPEVDYLSKPLLNERHFIEWQKKKSEEIKNNYDYVRHKYKTMLNKIEESRIPCSQKKAPKVKTFTKKELRDMHKFAVKYPEKYENYTYEELLAMDERNLEKKKSIVEPDWVKAYMNDLSQRLAKKSSSETFQKQISNVLSNSLWDASVEAEESKVDREIAKKAMKLSQFEKQMCTQLMETKQQARNLFQNRIEAQKKYDEQRDHQFNQYLDNVRDQILMEEAELSFERNRQEMLHRRLYAEKIKRKRQHFYEICYDTMLSLVDYASKVAYWQRMLEDESIPDHFIHEWKTLFFKQQAIFDILDPMEDILKEPALEEEGSAEEEEIIRLELDRQEVLNDSEFLEYHNYTDPWILEHLVPNFNDETEDRKYEYLGGRILGHVVYTLLEIKYPRPPALPPADLPQFSSKALVRNLPDKAITIPMQILLDQSKICVVRLEPAINFCLRTYKTEMIGCSDIDLSYDKFTAAAIEEDGKEFVKSLKADDDAYNKSSETTIASLYGPIPPNCKNTQTPKVLPEEDMTLSKPASLGKYAYEALSFGDSLTDHLLAAILVEFIKNQKDINGFVIINYPNSYREAKILEETFSGREPPDEQELLEDSDDIYLEETIAKHRRKERDPYKEIRVSRIVSNPHKIKRQAPFESYFTCYIRLKETEDILQEYVIWDLNEENSELIDRFYAILGLNYSLYYEIIDKDLLSQMCKYIIGDLTLPLKSNETLFGLNVLSGLDFIAPSDKRTRSKVIKPEVSSSKTKSTKLRRGASKTSNSSMDLEVVKAPESIEATAEQTVTDEEDDSQAKAIILEEEVVLQPGEEDWDYGELPITEKIGIALATCWEEIEKAYIHDLEQLFFSKRLQMNCLVPYCRFIRDKIEQIITLPSYKQDLVCRFQKEYNDFEDDWRPITLTKNEWHCRIRDLQTRLYNICDERKIFAQQQRHNLIIDNWTAEELTTMANTYISCMQTELNRSIMTFQTLYDFYYAMLKKLPPNEKLTCRELIKINRDTEDTGSGRRPTEDKVFRQLKLAFQEMHLKNILLDFSNNPVNMILENNVKLALKFVKELNDYFRSVITKEYNEVSKMVPVAKKKEETVSSQDTVNLEEIWQQNALKCVDEWLMGINGEMYRMNLRILVLYYKCLHDMKLFNDTINNAFTAIQKYIDTYYMNEIRSVDRLCKYMQLAVENGVKIPETLILEHDNFVIDPNLLQFEPETQPDFSVIGEDVDTLLEFKISQLARLRSQFKIVAPTGIALQQAFIYLLQDFIFFGKESCEGPLFPELFKRIDHNKVSKLVFNLFGETSYVDWRDFLIYCLNVRFPTVEELLETRSLYRREYDMTSTELIYRDDFIKTPLWYESDFEQNDPHILLRKNLIKHFLFELFETEQNRMNYSAFLLAFCKGLDPIEGFTSALSMAVGKKTCYVFEECEAVVCMLIKRKQERDEQYAIALGIVNEFLEELITKVVNICETTTIEEVPYTEEETEVKKGKAKNKKGNKKDESQSARSPEKGKIDKNGKARSESDIKQVFICPPCDVPPTPEEKLEREEMEEEQKSDVFPDPDIAYVVSQDVIWRVLRVCLPWHFALIPDRKPTPYEDQVKDVLKKLEVNTDNGDIYVAMFVSDPTICKLLHKVKKFTVLNLISEVRNVCI